MKRVGYYSPMPPAQSGVADYSAALLPHLRRLGPIEANPESCDLGIYHIGNNALHRDVYERAIAQPGVVVLHDAVLHHLFLGWLEPGAYLARFVSEYGEWSRGLGEELWRERARSGADVRYFAHSMIKEVASSAKAVIVHNPLAAKMVWEHAPNARVVEIPHLFVAPAESSIRESLGVGPETLLVGSFGYHRETKRLPVLLRAFDLAVRAGADARFLISGGFVSQIYERSIEGLLPKNVIRTGHLPEAEFWRHAAAADLCVNLRYPSAGETSGMAIRMMGLGKVVAMTNDESIARFPRNACLRVDAGSAEEEMLAGYIAWLAREPDAARAIGRNAAAYIVAAHAPERVASAYWEVVESCF